MEISVAGIAGTFLAASAVFVAIAAVSFVLWLAVIRGFGSSVFKGGDGAIGPAQAGLDIPVFILIVLVSAYFTISIAAPELFSHQILQIWEIATLVAGIVIIGKLLGLLVEHRCRTTPDLYPLAARLAFIRSAINFFLYSAGVIMVVGIVKPPLGMVVAVFGGLLMVFAFMLFFDHLKNMFAGVQLGSGRVKEGDYIDAPGFSGIVEGVRGRRTLVSTCDGTVHIPNTSLVGASITNHALAGGGNRFRITIGFQGTGIAKARKAAESAARRIAGIGGVMAAPPAEAVFDGIIDGGARFSVWFAIGPGQDVPRVMEKARLAAALGAGGASLVC